MSTVLKTDASGAVVVPASLCRQVGLEPGTDLVADIQAGRIILEPPQSSLARKIAEMAEALPQEFIHQLPADGATEHDHYLYGTPKRSA